MAADAFVDAQASSGIDLSGVHIPAVTPFLASGELDEAGFVANARAWVGHPIQGLVVGGSTGEAVLLDESERIRSWELARDVLGDRLLIAGTGAESLRATLHLTREAARAGADAVLVQPPAFYRGAMTPVALEEHYRALADASPVPVIVYQVPLHLGSLDIPNTVVAALSSHENIVGIKDSRGKLELVQELASICAAGFQILVGNGALLFAALEAGAVGGILGVANILPGECGALWQEWSRGDRGRAAQIQDVVAPGHTGVGGGMGVPGVKRGLDLLGMTGGDPRPPLRPLAQDREVELRLLLEGSGTLDG